MTMIRSISSVKSQPRLVSSVKIPTKTPSNLLKICPLIRRKFSRLREPCKDLQASSTSLKIRTRGNLFHHPLKIFQPRVLPRCLSLELPRPASTSKISQDLSREPKRLSEEWKTRSLVNAKRGPCPNPEVRRPRNRDPAPMVRSYSSTLKRTLTTFHSPINLTLHPPRKVSKSSGLRSWIDFSEEVSQIKTIMKILRSWIWMIPNQMVLSCPLALLSLEVPHSLTCLSIFHSMIFLLKTSLKPDPSYLLFLDSLWNPMIFLSIQRMKTNSS